MKEISQWNEAEEALIRNEFNHLLEDYAATTHIQRVEIITRAFEFAHKAHQGIRRRSGEPYIMHPIEVSRIVVNEIGLGSTSICAALLHDVVEDTDYTCDDIANLFNPKIASIVDGLTKISGGIFGEKASEQAENFRKLILTIPEDIRVILIKMADRLHNMRTLDSMPRVKQLKITGETQYIYAPLAERLGFGSIKAQLEDLSFKYEQPEVYQEIDKKINQLHPVLIESFNRFIAPIQNILDSYGYTYKIQKRIKTPYSVYKKMRKQSLNFEEIYDLLAVRIIVTPKENEDEKATCWITYSAITSIYKPHPSRTRDWINTPKSNGYEALHLTVMNPAGQWVEVQIRSNRMDDIAEKGIAAHWKYKTGDQDSILDDWFMSIKDLLDSEDYSNAVEFMDTFKLNLYSSELCVFTPKGEIKTLPANSTVLDFAFSIHSALGSKCIGAKVDHKLVPYSYKLKSGEQVEVLTANNQHPKMDWMDVVTTSKAKNQLRSLLKSEYRQLEKKGNKLIDQALAGINLPPNGENIEKIRMHYNAPNTQELYIQAAQGKLDLDQIATLFISKKTKTTLSKIWQLSFNPFSSNDKSKKSKKEINITDKDLGTKYKIATCCNPIPGDIVCGYKEDDNSITVHKNSCPIALKLQSSYGNRIVSANWATKNVQSFPATIEIDGIDSVGLVLKITNIISQKYNINIKEVHLTTFDGLFKGTISLLIYNIDDLTSIIKSIKAISSIKKVTRTE